MEIVFAIISIVGALGLFIFGMKIMSEGIQQFAGKTMRRTVDRVASSDFKGILTGFITTSLIQSSSAATVMIVSFANAGIFKLRQAITVIMGANIGTTITAWLFLVFGFTKVGVWLYLWPLLAIATPFIFVKRSSLKNVGQVIFGFCIMFLGLGQLKFFFEGLNLQDNVRFFEIINSFGSMGFVSILSFLLIGTLLTIIVQSSTVAMGLTLAFCTSGLPLELGFALVLGENLGTTVTANIAALVANVHGKRAARAHTLFNLITIVWALIFFSPILSLVDNIIGSTNFGSPLKDDNTVAVAAALAFLHSFINIVNTIICSGFVKNIEKIVVRFTPSTNSKDEEFSLEYMEQGITSTSVLYILEAKKQLSHFGLILKRMSDNVRFLLFEPDPENQNIHFEKINQFENITEKVEQQVSDYLAKISRHDLSEKMSYRVKTLLSMVAEMERIGHKFFQMSLIIKQKNDDKIWFNSEQRNNLKEIYNLLDLAIENLYQNLKKEFDEVSDSEANDIENQINTLCQKLKVDYLEQIEAKKFSLKSGMIYIDIITQCEKAANDILKVTLLMTK